MIGCLTLQDFKILYVCIFAVDVELDARHGNIEENAVKDLAKSGTRGNKIQWLAEIRPNCCIGRVSLPEHSSRRRHRRKYRR